MAFLKCLFQMIRSGFYERVLSRHPLYHLSKVKVLIFKKGEEGEEPKKLFRVPSHIHYAIPDPLSNQFIE